MVKVSVALFFLTSLKVPLKGKILPLRSKVNLQGVAGMVMVFVLKSDEVSAQAQSVITKARIINRFISAKYKKGSTREP